MSHKTRLSKLERNPAAARKIYKIEWCTEAQAAELEAQRPPAAPGEIRYIIVPPEHMPMWFGPLDAAEGSP